MLVNILADVAKLMWGGGVILIWAHIYRPKDIGYDHYPGYDGQHNIGETSSHSTN